MTPALVTMGETLAALSSADVVPLRHARFLALGVGGAESNVAIGAARLGVPTAWMGRVGDDELGMLIEQRLRGERVDSRAVTDPDLPTALMVKSRRRAGRSRVHYYRHGSAGSALCPDDVDTELIRGARVLHISGITPALSETARAATYHAIDMAREQGVPVSTDFNYRKALWTVQYAGAEFQELARRSDLVFASDDEAVMAVGEGTVGQRAARIAELGASQVVIKLGADGAFGYTARESHSVAAVPTDTVDHVGAGDAFAAGFLAALIDGENLVGRLRLGVRLGAYAVSVDGDWEGLPTRRELDAETAETDNVHR